MLASKLSHLVQLLRLNTNQLVEARYEYDPCGRLIGKWGLLADPNVYRFSSKEYDVISGAYYSGYRFYQPELMRWLSRDPIGERGGINLYQAFRNNPLRWIDPYGLINADRYEEIEQQQEHQTGWSYYAGQDGTVQIAGEVGMQQSDLALLNGLTDLALDWVVATVNSDGPMGLPGAGSSPMPWKMMQRRWQRGASL